ncbi:Uncharacterized protein SCF082_LOCUS19475 [Durusdinium trenchii]|uniref:Uncharacterized protein n=1 Tax=Durusdinium trenchii TaxID=1381693 RepID=A0ABP0KW13_9DINO
MLDRRSRCIERPLHSLCSWRRILHGFLLFWSFHWTEAEEVVNEPDFQKFIEEKILFFERSRQRMLQDNVATEDVVDIQYSNLTWIPPLDLSPPGAFGGACLYAGTNYTSWRIHTDKNMTDNTARLRAVRPNLQTPGAPAGHCLIEEYNFVDVVPPLDGSITFRAQLTEVWYTGGITFSQGGQVKLCLSPLGTFADPSIPALGDAALVPDGYTEYRVLGAMDTCDQGPGCLQKRRFFCHLPHQYYTRYLPYDLNCDMFLQATSSPLLYSRMAVMDDEQCGKRTGLSMVANFEGYWERIVDPITKIELGKTREDRTQGFHYLLCFCPAFDASEGIFPVIDGVCGQFDDFVQQVGVLDGLMTTFLDVDSVVVEQILPMTRFTIRVDCGGGFDSCDANDFSSIKVIPRSWSSLDSSIGLMHWNTSNSCPEAVETSQWYSPVNCQDHRVLRAFHSALFGRFIVSVSTQVTRSHVFLPLSCFLEAGVAQFFDICFVHKDPAVDGLNIRSFEPFGDAAMQETTRTFFKVGQLVVEPLWLYGTDGWVILEDQTTGSLDAYGCFGFIPNEAGVYCANRSFCTPRATKTGWGLRETNTIRILERGKTCREVMVTSSQSNNNGVSSARHSRIGGVVSVMCGLEGETCCSSFFLDVKSYQSAPEQRPLHASKASEILNFITGDNPQYYLPQNSMQLRQGFPVPVGCYVTPSAHSTWYIQHGSNKHGRSSEVDTNRYGSEGRVIAIYLLFEALNGLQAQTSYTIVRTARSCFAFSAHVSQYFDRHTT